MQDIRSAMRIANIKNQIDKWKVCLKNAPDNPKAPMWKAKIPQYEAMVKWYEQKKHLTEHKPGSVVIPVPTGNASASGH